MGEEIQCESCKATAFRRSRLKLKDFGTLLALHYPVRCMACSKRQRVAFGVARRAVPAFRVDRVDRNESALNPAPRQSAVERMAKAAEAAEGEGSLPEDSRLPVAMPDLHGVRLPHVAHLPPGDGENLTGSR